MTQRMSKLFDNDDNYDDDTEPVHVTEARDDIYDDEKLSRDKCTEHRVSHNNSKTLTAPPVQLELNFTT